MYTILFCTEEEYIEYIEGRVIEYIILKIDKFLLLQNYISVIGVKHRTNTRIWFMYNMHYWNIKNVPLNVVSIA